VAVFESARLLADPDFDDNLDATLESLGVTRGKFLTIVDEDGQWGNLSIAICDIDVSMDQYLLLPTQLPIPRKVEKTKKRRLSSSPPVETGAVNGSPVKRAKLNGITNNSTIKTPTKKQRFEMEGLVIMEKDDDIVLIDD